jgi:hypothetical protein
MSANGKSDVLTPKQAAFLAAYFDPKSPTFGTARGTAKAVGYSDEYADNIMALLPDWLSEHIGDMSMLHTAEENLKDFLDDKTDRRIQADITKFVASSLGKRKYSTKTEVEQKNINYNKNMDEMSVSELQEILSS